MSLCTVCGRHLCDHTPAEREQTLEEMMRPPSDEEFNVWVGEPADSDKKIAVANSHAHDPVT